MRYRFQWTAPIAVSPHDPKVVYHARQRDLPHRGRRPDLDRRSARDLTRNDKSKQQWSGGPITGDNTGVETYCTVFAIAESPVQKGLIWAGSDDGLVHVTEDGGKTWKNVTANVPGLPEWGTVSMIEPSRFDAGTAYLVVDAHRLDDMRPYLWKTSDLGRTWKRLDGDLPQDVYLHAVREDPPRRGTLYLGTERGVAFSTRRRRHLALAAPQPAHGGGARPAGQGRQPGRGHPRPVDLDPRRPARCVRAADAKDVEAQGSPPLPRAGRRPLERSAPYPGIGWQGEQPAARRADLLLAEGGAQGRHQAGDPGRLGPRGEHP